MRFQEALTGRRIAHTTDREQIFAAGNRLHLLSRSQIIQTIRQPNSEPENVPHQQPLPITIQQQEVNFGDFECRDPEIFDFDYEPLDSDRATPVYSKPPKSNVYYQQTLITAHAVKESNSQAKTDRLMSTMEVLFDNELQVTAAAIEKEKNNWVSDFKIQEKIFCGGKDCQKSFSMLSAVCTCGASKDAKVTVSSSTIIPHILIIAKKYEDELFTERVQTNKRSDLTDYMSADYDPSCLELHFILNTDGVQPKQNSRKPFHPVFIMIKNLGGPLRSKQSNILLSAMIFGLKTPPEWLWEFALKGLQSDMERLKVGIPFVRKDGTRVLLKAKISDVAIDQIASQMVYQHCSHTAFGFGCTQCDVFPTREDNAQRWPLKSGKLRSEDNNRTGLAVVDTAFCKIAPESLLRLDGLHVLDEGLCKTLLNLLFDEFKILRNILTDINRTMLKTGASSLALKGNAHETRKLFTLCIPILFAIEAANPKLQAAVLFWLFCRLLYFKCLNTDIIDEIVPLFEKMGEIMENIFGTKFKTIKGHKLFSHGGLELKFHGSPADFSAAAFECANRLLKYLIDPQNTRGFDRLLHKKHLLHVVMESKIDEMVKILNLDPKKYEYLYVNPPKSYTSQTVNFNGTLLPLMMENEQVFFSVQQNGFNHKFNPTKETCSFFKATLNGVGCCYKALIGIERNNEKFLLSQKLSTFNPVTTDLFYDELKPIAEVLTRYQTFAFELSAEQDNNNFILIPLKNVVAFVLHIEFSDRKFLIDVSERFNKT